MKRSKVALGLATALIAIGAIYFALQPHHALQTTSPNSLKHYRFISIEKDGEESVTLQRWMGKPLLVMFWRADCPPCLIELRELANILSMHQDLSVALISLQDVAHTKNKLPALPKNVSVLVAQEDTSSLLAAFGNDKVLALPYSVMLDAHGNRCGQYHGILTAQQVNQWVQQCGQH